MERRACPGCESAMQVFHARGVEIDRCFFCGGLWFDAGELERVSGRDLAVDAAQGATRRRCAGCGQTLAPGTLEGVALERCGGCRGIYLDDGELQQVTKAPVPLQKKDPTRVELGLTFVCPGCQNERPLDEGARTPRGMACGNCYGALSQTSSVLSPSYGYLTGRRPWLEREDAVTAEDVLLRVLRFFS